MSWQTYVDSNLLGTGKVQKAVILGRKGGVWASSNGHKLSPEEQKVIINAFDKAEEIQANGVHLFGRKFYTLQCDSDHVYGKKGADGCILVKTKQAILVAEYVAPIQAAEATPVVEGLADYLRSVDY